MNNKQKSPIDSIIIDLILDHYNMQSLTNRKVVLSSDEFDSIVIQAKELYYENVMMDTPLGQEGIS
jgi:hypothetical protein|tara:strand:+ start:204 stop:401 length:198 start_codon:yes stop_codon:yes gene_type:complete